MSYAVEILGFEGNFSAQFEKVFEGSAGKSKVFGVSNVIGRRPRFHVAGKASSKVFACRR